MLSEESGLGGARTVQFGSGLGQRRSRLFAGHFAQRAFKFPLISLHGLHLKVRFPLGQAEVHQGKLFPLSVVEEVARLDISVDDILAMYELTISFLLVIILSCHRQCKQ